VDTELKDFVPGLFMAWCEPGQSEPTFLGKYIVPQHFMTIFMFKDKNANDWEVVFTITVSELNTPALDSVTIRHSVDRWKIKLIEQYRYQLFELALKIVVKTRVPAYCLEDEYNLIMVATFRLMSQMGVGTLNPVLMELPTNIKGVPTKFVRYWDGNANPLNVVELKDLSKTINTTLRKRVTPEYLQYIADIYTKAVLDGQNPVQTIMETERVKHRTASEYATKARNLGLLPKTDPGIVTINRPTTKKGKK